MNKPAETIINLLWFAADGEHIPDPPAGELREEIARAEEEVARFNLLYSSRGPILELLEKGQINAELFLLCGVRATALDEETEPMKGANETR